MGGALSKRDGEALQRKGEKMIKQIKCAALPLLLVTVLLFVTACGASGTMLKFSFSTETLTDSSDEQTIYINDDTAQIKLNGKLNVDCGEVFVDVIDPVNGEAVWRGNYRKNAKFLIRLENLKAGSEYSIKVEALQSKEVKLTINIVI